MSEPAPEPRRLPDDLGHLPGVLVCVAAAVILFANLGVVVFWGDEAETAILARNALHSGLPRAWDGRNLVESLGIGFNDRLVWNQQPWLSIYLAAGSFALFGEDTTAGRIPFALAGLLTVILTGVLVHKETRSRPQALLAMGLLTANVQFLLFARQCRYYALLPLGVVLLLLAWRKIEEFPGAVLFGLAAAFLFHANYLAVVPTLGAFWIHALIWRREKPVLLDLALATVLCALLTIPWAFYAEIGSTVRQLPGLSAGEWLFRVKTYASKVSRRIIPFSFLLALFVPYVRGRLPERRLARLCVLILLAHVLFIPLAGPALVLRYAVGLFPLGAVLAASLFAALWRWRRPVAAAVAAVFVATHLWNALDIAATNAVKFAVGATDTFENRWIREDRPRLFLRVEYLDYAREVLHGFPENPNLLLVQFVREHVKPGELVATGHDWLPLIFYTDARIMGAWETPADMVEIKRGIPGYVNEPWGEPVFWYLHRKNYWKALLPEILARAERGEYRVEKFETSIPDIPHGNDPDLDSRIRQGLAGYGTIDIYRVEKVSSPASAPGVVLRPVRRSPLAGRVRPEGKG
ncbi:MAG: glycosyltransferase family 39 protein [Planctomycetota bacterium]